MSDRQELEELRRLEELEARAAKSPPPPREAPGSKPLASYGQELKRSGMEMMGGLLRGGPGGLVTAAGSEMSRRTGDVMDRAAYEAGGAVTDLAGPEAGFATNVGVQALPTLLGGFLGKRIGEPAVKSLSERLMINSLKPDAKARVAGFAGAPSKAQIAAKVMLEQGANASEGGVSKLMAQVSPRKAEITKLIEEAGAKGATVERSVLGRGQGEIEKRFAQRLNPAAREADLAAIRSRFLDLATDPKIPERIPVAQLQALKEGEQAALKQAYRRVGGVTPADEAVSKDLARQARLALEEAVPGVGPKNKALADVLTAIEIADKRAGIAQNANPLGITPAAMNPKMMGAMLLDRSSLLKSMLARLLYKGQGAVPTTAGAVAGADLGARSGESR